MKHGDPLAGGIIRDLDRQREPCSIDGCEERRHARMLCDAHYSRWLRFGDPLHEIPKADPKTCSVCEQGAVARGWCASHYSKWRKHGDPNFISTPRTRRKRVRTLDKSGYVQLYRPEHPNARKGGTIAEHTVVMSEVLGRPLLPGENVHHKNGIRNDNRPENLELWARCQPPGQRVKDLVAWANELIARYGSNPDEIP